MKVLVVVDMQNDFIDGSLGTPEAQRILPRVYEKIRGFDGEVLFTQDTHDDQYLNTQEGSHLPVPHCVKGTLGWEIHPDVRRCAPDAQVFEKGTFASLALGQYLAQRDVESVELIGLCTDICVVSNALLMKACLPEVPVLVDASCCAGVTPASHAAALDTMKSCQVRVTGENG